MTGKKVLVVDDEPEIVQSVAMLFKSKGYQVVTAGDGKRAMQVALEEKPDLLILDISMPERNGHYVAKRLGKNAETSSIPILFLTAREGIEDFQMAYEEGVARYLTKPYKNEELLLAAEQLILRMK